MKTGRTVVNTSAFLTFFTMLMDKGEEGKVVQELLRHSTSRMTLDTYTQVEPGARYFPSALARDSLAMVERSLFRAKINSDYNDFVARVALEVVDSAWWKQQLRVKSAGGGKLFCHGTDRTIL